MNSCMATQYQHLFSGASGRLSDIDERSGCMADKNDQTNRVAKMVKSQPFSHHLCTKFPLLATGGVTGASHRGRAGVEQGRADWRVHNQLSAPRPRRDADRAGGGETCRVASGDVRLRCRCKERRRRETHRRRSRNLRAGRLKPQARAARGVSAMLCRPMPTTIAAQNKATCQPP